jgi:hypothetical protein
MEHDEDKQDLNPPNAQEPGQDILGEAQSADDGRGSDAPDGSDQSAESQIPSAPLTPQEAAPSAEDPAKPDAPQRVTGPSGGAAMQPAGQVTRIELPAELEVSLATPPPVTTGDRHSHLLPLERGEKSEGDPDPLGPIFPPAGRLPVDSSAPFHAAESAVADESPESLGKTMPRVHVLVTLLESQTMYSAAIDEALEGHAAKYRQIAESEVERGFWHYENQRRAADWRLRGP